MFYFAAISDGAPSNYVNSAVFLYMMSYFGERVSTFLIGFQGLVSRHSIGQVETSSMGDNLRVNHSAKAVSRHPILDPDVSNSLICFVSVHPCQLQT